MLGVRTLVTGCAGFIGSHLTEALLQERYEVVGVDCFNENYGRPEKLRNLESARTWDDFDFVPLDLARGSLEDLVEDCDVVFHLAAEPGVRASWGERFELYLRNNVLATQHLLEASRKWPDKRFVYASSSSIYGEADVFPTKESAVPKPLSPYGMTKLSGEHLCSTYHANFGVDVVRLRYFSVYGPRQRPDMAFNIFCRAALAGEPIRVFGDGAQTRDFTFVSDVVAATMTAAFVPSVGGGVFNVGGGSRVSLDQAIEIIVELAGRHVEVEHGRAQRGDVRHTGADIAAARELLEYEPRVDIRQGLAAEWEWTLEGWPRGSPTTAPLDSSSSVVPRS
jgi:UDP-glucuronate 4-epimerase